MFVILSSYDEGFVSSMALGRKLYSDEDISQLVYAFERRSPGDILKYMNEKVSDHGYRPENSYNIICCVDGCIYRCMLTVDVFNDRCHYEFIAHTGNRSGGSFDI